MSKKVIKKGEGELSKRRIQRRKIKKLTFGVTDVLTNVALYSLYLGINMLVEGGKGPITVYRSFNKADEWIGEFDSKKLRKAFYNLYQKGLVTSLRNASALPKITKNGIDKIKNTFPSYDEKRIWDKSLYTVYYDIPVQKNYQRNIFRDFLRRLKAVKLQDSIYLTPYNPENIIDRIINEYGIEGQILVSTLNPYRGLKNIGDIKDFLWDIYDLEKVNREYKRFLSKERRFKKGELEYNPPSLVFEYLSILQKDPQLPFELILDKYLGDRAYLFFKRVVKVLQ